MRDKLLPLLKREASPDVKLSVISLFIGKMMEVYDKRINYLEDRQLQKGDKGDRGEKGDQGKEGKDGAPGKDGKDGKDGLSGKDGKSGTKGKDGQDGIDGRDGVDGKDGKDGTEIKAEEIKQKLESLEVGLDYEKLSNVPDIAKIARMASSKTVSMV